MDYHLFQQIGLKIIGISGMIMIGLWLAVHGVLTSYQATKNRSIPQLNTLFYGVTQIIGGGLIIIMLLAHIS